MRAVELRMRASRARAFPRRSHTQAHGRAPHQTALVRWAYHVQQRGTAASGQREAASSGDRTGHCARPSWPLRGSDLGRGTRRQLLPELLGLGLARVPLGCRNRPRCSEARHTRGARRRVSRRVAGAARLDRRISALVADDDTDDVRGRASARLRLVCTRTSRPRTAQPPAFCSRRYWRGSSPLLVRARDAAAPGSCRHLQLLCRLPAVRAARLLERTFDLRRDRNRGRRRARSQSRGSRRASALRGEPRAPRPCALLHVRTRRLARACVRDRRSDRHRSAASSTRDHASGGGALARARRVARIRVAESDHAVLSARRRIARGRPTRLDDCAPCGRLGPRHRGLHAPCRPRSPSDVVSGVPTEPHSPLSS